MLKTKFFSSGPVKLPNGTLGLFNSNSSSSALTLYTFGSDTVASTTSLPSATSNPTTLGIPSTAVITHGGGNSSVYRYNFPTTATAIGSSLSANALFAGGINNSTIGILPYGVTNPVSTNKYIFSSDAMTAGGALNFGGSIAQAARQSIGNSTVGIIPRTFSGSGNTNSTVAYTYSSDSSVAGGNFTATSGATKATGISTLGLFIINSTTTNKYTYSSNTTAVGTAPPSPTPGPGAGSNTLGLFANFTNGSGTTKYTYSDDSILSSTSLGTNQPSGTSAGASSNGVLGVSA